MKYRLIAIVLVAIIATGCTGDQEAKQMGRLELSSPAFKDGESIPDKYGYTEENVNPPLTIEGVPEDAETLALIMDDPDAKPVAGKIWDHWVIWNIPPNTTKIPEDWTPNKAMEGINDFGEKGYGGPNPPNKHTYQFKLYALDTRLELPPTTDAEELEKAMRGHVIDQDQLTGTYAP